MSMLLVDVTSFAAMSVMAPFVPEQVLGRRILRWSELIG